MRKKLNIAVHLFFLSTFLCSCFKPDTQVGYYLYITKNDDSQPCEVEVRYPDMGKMKTVNVDADWSFSQKVHYDQAVTLKARALSNIKTLKLEIYAKEDPVSETCNSSCDTLEVTKALYQ